MHVRVHYHHKIPISLHRHSNSREGGKVQVKFYVENTIKTSIYSVVY